MTREDSKPAKVIKKRKSKVHTVHAMELIHCLRRRKLVKVLRVRFQVKVVDLMILSLAAQLL